MKKYFLIYLFNLVLISCLFSQTENNYSIHLEGTYGTILKHTKHLNNLVKGPVVGGELSVELQTMGEKDWHQYLGFPDIGLGAVVLNLGNDKMLGNLFALYPYLNFKLLRTNFIHVNLKAGAGASFLTKTFDNTATNPMDLNTGNAAIGSKLNVYFAGGLNFTIPIDYGFALVADMQWNHASNGSFYQPNSGINMLNASVGIAYAPYYKHSYTPRLRTRPRLSQYPAIELIAAGGVRELYYKDDKQYPTGSFIVAVYKPLGNAFRLGLGVESFYDGVYNGKTEFKRTYLNEDKLANKIRVGLALRPELVFGRFSAGIHFGMYVYNPLKNLEPYNDASVAQLDKPLFYKYNVEEEDGWFYTRAALQYSMTDNLFLSLGLKTHLHKAEFIEWGIGYRFQTRKAEMPVIRTR